MRNSVVSLLLCAGFTCSSGLSKSLNSSMNEGYMSRKAVSNCSKKVAESSSDKREEEVMLSKSFPCPTLIFRCTNNSNLLSRSMNLAHRSIYSFANRSRCLLVSIKRVLSKLSASLRLDNCVLLSDSLIRHTTTFRFSDSFLWKQYE